MGSTEKATLRVTENTITVSIPSSLVSSRIVIEFTLDWTQDAYIIATITKIYPLVGIELRQSHLIQKHPQNFMSRGIAQSHGSRVVRDWRNCESKYVSIGLV